MDEWNEIKKTINKSQVTNKYPKECEVWMSSLGLNVGYEQNGVGNSFLRPVLIIKKVNNQIFWCIPLSTKQKKIDFYYNFTDPNGKRVSAIFAQIKTQSQKRFHRKLYTMNNSDYVRLKNAIKSYL